MKKQRAKQIISLVSVAAILLLIVFLTWFFMTNVSEIMDAESFKDFVLSFGTKGILVGFGVQVLQVFGAFIPGEVIEIGLGYAYGAILGTIICFGGLIAASAVIFSLVKKFGIRMVELFTSKEHFYEMKFIKKAVENPERLQKLVFLLYIIPGTPKDLFVYLFGLTPMSCREFLMISTLARIPSVVSSTVGGMLIHNGNYLAAGILFAVTAVLSIVGMAAYRNKK